MPKDFTYGRRVDRALRRARRRIKKLERQAQRLLDREDRLLKKVNPYKPGSDDWHMFNLRGRSWGHIMTVTDVETHSGGLEAVCYVYAPDTFVLTEGEQRWVELNRDFLATLSEQTGVSEALLGNVEIPEGIDKVLYGEGRPEAFPEELTEP